MLMEMFIKAIGSTVRQKDMECTTILMDRAILDNGSKMSKKAMVFKKRLMGLYIMGTLLVIKEFQKREKTWVR